MYGWLSLTNRLVAVEVNRIVEFLSLPFIHEVVCWCDWFWPGNETWGAMLADSGVVAAAAVAGPCCLWTLDHIFPDLSDHWLPIFGILAQRGP